MPLRPVRPDNRKLRLRATWARGVIKNQTSQAWLRRTTSSDRGFKSSRFEHLESDYTQGSIEPDCRLQNSNLVWEVWLAHSKNLYMRDLVCQPSLTFFVWKKKNKKKDKWTRMGKAQTFLFVLLFTLRSPFYQILLFLANVYIGSIKWGCLFLKKKNFMNCFTEIFTDVVAGQAKILYILLLINQWLFFYNG